MWRPTPCAGPGLAGGVMTLMTSVAPPRAYVKGYWRGPFSVRSVEADGMGAHLEDLSRTSSLLRLEEDLHMGRLVEPSVDGTWPAAAPAPPPAPPPQRTASPRPATHRALHG